MFHPRSKFVSVASGSLALAAALTLTAQSARASAPSIPNIAIEPVPTCTLAYLNHMRETGRGFGLSTSGNEVVGLFFAGAALEKFGALPVIAGTAGLWGVTFIAAEILAGEAIDAAVDAPYLRMMRAITAARWATGIESKPTFEGLQAFVDQEILKNEDLEPAYRFARSELRRQNRQIVRDHHRFEKAIRDAENGFMNLFIQLWDVGVRTLVLEDGSHVEMTPENFARKLANLDTTQLLCSGEVGNRGLERPEGLEPVVDTDGLEGRELKKAERENRHIENRNDRRWRKYQKQALATPKDLAVYLMNEEAMN